MSSSAKKRKITANLPTDLVERALAVTGKGLTPTLVEALEELDRRSHRSALRALRGKLRFSLDLEATRR
jgi:hypothetical protein